MSAQYRPYRDEESVDGLEATNWTDHEPGSIRIYEKTTEELPFNATSRRMLWIQLALILVVGFLGFWLGYFVRFYPNMSHYDSLAILASDSVTDDDLKTYMKFNYEDSTIKEKLLNNIDGNNILNYFNTYKELNRLPGTDEDHKFAQHVQDAFSEFGFDHVTVTNYTFKTMLPLKPTAIKLLDRKNRTLYSNLDEENYAHEDMRPILPLSQANATVIYTNQLLYVNRGTKEDYIKLSAIGVSSNETEGKIFVIRQGFYQAHDLVISAQDRGARAVLLFPDPEIYGDSSPFPPQMRLPNDAGRSHPTAWTNYGDLASLNLTFSGGLDASKTMIDKDLRLLIPIIPISYNTAYKILRGLTGAVAPSDWNCFDFTLYIGPGYKEENIEDQRNSLLIEFHNQEMSITTPTVTGTIVGSVEPDRYIVLGSRRDSLNRGLLDSVSGTAVMLEIARVYGALLQHSWRPRRTIIFNSFGAESLNLIGSSNWLETHQRLLHARAIAYINCDLIITGNQSATIAASPLLYQVLYNATKQVVNPNIQDEPDKPTVYDSWRAQHHHNKKDELSIDVELERLINDYDTVVESRLPKGVQAPPEEAEPTDEFARPGSILHEYKRSAIVKTRPKVRRLDLSSIYSPFFLYTGMPVVDVRYTGFSSVRNKSNLLEDMLPLIGTKYDNLATIQHIDPHLKYHITVAKILAEMLRDLSDSVYLPFNLLDYAVTLKDSFNSFVANYGKTVAQSNLDLEPLKQVIHDFTRAAIKFHHRQDHASSRDPMQVRKFNDQLALLERAFVDPFASPGWDRKHTILTTNDGSEHKGGFPALIDWIVLLEGDTLEPNDYQLFVDILRLNFKAIIHTISNAMKILNEVHIL